ncbi:MAG: V-type ATP synthase subunit E [Longibaculum muris]|uniref:Vacuolar-type H+-ATPase subunit E/Vma4 n=1 Tax=Longibaculum muris TaxID=1796628 RepID=A0A4R3YGD7_9FIRM|nr:V-type ATP synthase subunit E [Longibaculum muris]KXU42893.1 putative ATP synthase, subunit E [Candidatus Stoquefichus sp. KLE1796]MBS5369353.1 V-type ATP synthase subunit E [Coprobacillus cateniformis]MCR1889117.1 V-type ATP synthase subunit E [Longibaculum muris]MED9810734.1 V-type ATP synthase subunit E [Longibaculum muris]TCV91655.1 vacuolar-type H+-ATPase subunit E/Vma4 [Longibaculum muris]
MQNIDQVFLYMKDEIERQAKNEEKAILDEVKALEDEAYESMRAEAKRDADLKLKQEEEEMSSNASAEISESHIERTKKLIEKRDEYVKAIFEKAHEELVAFTKSADYASFMESKIKKVADDFKDSHSIMYVSAKDLAMKADLVKAFGQDIDVEASDDITIGGFIIENKESSLVVDETLDFALNNQKEWFNKNSGLIIR